jgi:hypothetical protein
MERYFLDYEANLAVRPCTSSPEAAGKISRIHIQFRVRTPDVFVDDLSSHQFDQVCF